MVQSALLQEVTDSTVIRPSNAQQWRVVRDTAAPGSGKYYAYDNLTNKEEIGGPAVGSLAVEVTSADGLALTAAVTGGVAPLTYAWSRKSTFINGTNIAFSGAVNAAVANIDNAAASYDGTVVVKVTDAGGKVGYGYWHTRKDEVIP